MLEVCDGTSQNGSMDVIGSGKPLAVGGGARSASERLWVVLSRASTKKSSGAALLLVMVTGTVTGVPAASVVDALCGRPTALTVTSLNLMLPVNGWETSSPTIGSAKSTTSVQLPGAGLRV